MTVLRPNSMPVAVSPGSGHARLLGITFLLAAPEHRQDERVCCPQPAPCKPLSSAFWAERCGGDRHPQQLPGTMDREAVAIWRAVFALG